MANKFQYRLQKVLTMRVKREDNLKLELSEVQRIAIDEKAALDDLKQREQNAQRGMNQQLEAGRTADVQMSNDYLGSLKDKITAQEKKHQAASTQVKAVEEAYQKAQRDAEVVKKHKEKLHERWRVEDKRLEGIRSDEMVANMVQAKERKRLASEEEDADHERKREQAEAMLAESSWMQGFLQTANEEAERLANEWGR